MKSNKIYIIQMHTHTMPSRLIKLFTHYKYSHIAISLTPKCDKIYSFGRKELNSIINSGFVIENRDGAFSNTSATKKLQTYLFLKRTGILKNLNTIPIKSYLYKSE